MSDFVDKCIELGIPKQAVIAYKQHYGGSYDDVIPRVKLHYDKLNYILEKVSPLGVSKIAVEEYIRRHKDMSKEDIVAFYVQRYNNTGKSINRLCKESNVCYNTVKKYMKNYSLDINEAIELAKQRKKERKDKRLSLGNYYVY